MRGLARTLALLAAAVVGLAAGAGARAEAPADYASQLARLKGGDLGIDFEALRLAYASSPQYRPYGADMALKQTMMSAYRDGDCAKALAAADRILEGDFVDLGGQLVDARCQEKLGDPEKAKFHNAVFLGLMQALVSSGDGRTTKTAYPVISVDEEYVAISYLGLRPSRQALVHEADHDFDQLDVTDPRTGKTMSLYFNVDLPLHWLNRRLSGGAGQ